MKERRVKEAKNRWDKKPTNKLINVNPNTSIIV